MTIHVQLIHNTQPHCWDEIADGRWRPWQWLATTSGRDIARSAGKYAHRQECIADIRAVFGDDEAILHTDTRLGEVLRDGDR